MTVVAARRHHHTANILSHVILLIGFVTFLLASPRIADSIRNALAFCYKTLIPSLFPFMVLSELLAAAPVETGSVAQNKISICHRIFGVSWYGMTAFLFGALCGFPLGVKYTADLYRTGKLTRAEAEQLLSFADNTGPAFVVVGVGMGLLRSVKIGFLLYGVQIFSALIVGFLFAKLFPIHISDHMPTIQQHVNGEQRNLASAVRHSVTSMLGVCGMVVFFSSPIAILKDWIKNDGLLLFISSFLEIGNAVQLAAAKWSTMPYLAPLAMTNAICFGGLSVQLQASLFLTDLPRSMHRHIGGKLLQAAIACLLVQLVM